MKLGSSPSAISRVSKVLSDFLVNKSSRQHQKRPEALGAASSPEVVALEEVVHPLQRLIGHEGSIHRLTWSTDGLSLVSVLDDRRFVIAWLNFPSCALCFNEACQSLRVDILWFMHCG
jgi:hypothetical protein